MATDIHTAKQSLKNLFEALKLERVVCVDDEYCRWDKEELIGSLLAMDSEARAKINYLRQIDFDEAEDVWKEKVAKLWEENRQSFKDNVKIAIDALSSGKAAPAKLTGLSDLINDICDLVEVTPAEWEERKGALFDEASSKKTLFLFDKDLSKDGQGTSDGGIQLLEEAIGKNDTFCGILSNAFEGAEEFAAWTAFAKEHNVDCDRFVLISKEHLRDGSDYLGFARMIKLAIITPSCKGLAKAVGDSVAQSVNAALDLLRNLNVYDFEDIVFKKSHSEGVWEADTLYRIFGLFQRSTLQKQLNQNTEIQKQVKAIRSVIDIKTHEKYSSKEASWKIQKLEWYENAEDLNSHCIPLSLGDIFRSTTDGTEFILLCNACDLMLRADGQRESGLTEAYLVQIQDEQKGAQGVFELKYYANEKSKFVKFKMKHAVYLNVLDLCAMSETGSAAFVHGQKAPDILIPSWQKRFDELSDSFDRGINQILREAADESAKFVDTDVLPSSKERLFFGHFDHAQKSIIYECQRIGRLASPYSDALLSAFHTYLARPSFAADLAKS